MPRPNVGPGFKRYEITYSPGSTSPNPRIISDFGRGFGVRIVLGAQYLQSLQLTTSSVGEDPTFQRYEFRDGWQYPAPGGFERLVALLKTDVASGLCRIVIDVMTVPGMVWAVGGGYEFMGGKVAYPAAVHEDPGGSAPILLAGVSTLISEWYADGYQEDEQLGLAPLSANYRYGGRFHGDDGQAWPSSGLYFDGFLTANTAAYVDWRVWIFGMVVASGSLAQWLPYRVLSPLSAFPAVPATISSAINIQGQIACHLNNGGAVPLPLPVPANGFQIWVENFGASTITVRGLIGGRTA